MKFTNTMYRPLQIAILLLVGVLIGMMLAPSAMKPSFFGKHELPVTEQVIALIKANYNDTISEARLRQAGIEGMLDLLDPHSTYIPPVLAERSDEMISGKFGGVGVEFFMMNDTPMVIRVTPDGPAFKAGVKRGDKILKAGDSLLVNRKKNNEDVIKLIRGAEGSTVILTLLRNHEIINANITRGSIPSPSVQASFLIEPDIAYIKLDHFSETTYDEFMKALRSLKERGAQKLILDLRGNGGGLLEQATDIIDELLDQQKLMVYTKGRVYGKEEYKSRVLGIFEEQPVVLLTDENTASASEIIAGCLQDYDRATIIGRRTYGKGLVQVPYKLLDGGYLRLTVSYYYTPSGRCIQKSFNGNRDDYYHEIYTRKDSITAPQDTTVYYTAKGRKVYGGGGIQPDIYINDTASKTGYTPAGIDALYALMYGYAAQHENELLQHYTDADTFIKGFTISDALKQQIVLRTKMDYNDEVATRARALAARYLFGNDAYYRILMPEDAYMKKALEVLKR